MNEVQHQKISRYDPTIKLGDIFQAVVLAAAIIGGYTATQLQINSNTKDIEALKVSKQRIDEDIVRLKDQVREDIKDVRDEVKSVNENVLKVLGRLPD
ncbi:hypothetical protein [Endozoicomonas sp. Mp262]|uniref:hypothetical protein n=1 Tax=Endozoicomonas sp. Mp262 TaxID=2919499 RepID=UPI0021D9B951